MKLWILTHTFYMCHNAFHSVRDSANQVILGVTWHALGNKSNPARVSCWACPRPTSGDPPSLPLPGTPFDASRRQQGHRLGAVKQRTQIGTIMSPRGCRVCRLEVENDGEWRGRFGNGRLGVAAVFRRKAGWALFRVLIWSCTALFESFLESLEDVGL